MAFQRLFSTELSQTAAIEDFQTTFGEVDLPGVVDLSDDLKEEGPAIVKYVRYKLGEPVLSVHMDNRQIYNALEDATLKYSSIVNTYQAKSWMVQYYGLSNDFDNADLTGKLPAPFSNFLKRLTENLSWEMSPPIGGNSLGTIRKSYINLEMGKQDYDIYNDIIDSTDGTPVSATVKSLSASVNSTKIDLKTIYHFPSVTLYRFYDPYSSINMLSQEFNFESFNTETIFYVMPIWTDILRAQQLNMNDKVRRSNFSYERVGRRLRIFPSPKQAMKLFIDYTTSQQNPFDPNDISSVSGISNFYQVPFTDIAFSKVNAPGKYWIRNFAYALCMEVEGRIRRKFDKIPIPGDSLTLDGNALVQEGLAKQQELDKQLREDLDKLTVQNVMKENTEMQEMLLKQNKNIPLFIYMYE